MMKNAPRRSSRLFEIKKKAAAADVAPNQRE